MRTPMYVAVFILLFPITAFSEQYLCIPDKATGFAYDPRKKEWDYTQFKTNFKYIIAPANNGRDAFMLTKVGEKNPEYYCKDGFNKSGFLHCDTFGGVFHFNRKNGRYLMSYSVGYYIVGDWPAATDTDSDTPMVQIGKCSPF